MNRVGSLSVWLPGLPQLAWEGGRRPGYCDQVFFRSSGTIRLRV